MSPVDLSVHRPAMVGYWPTPDTIERARSDYVADRIEIGEFEARVAEIIEEEDWYLDKTPKRPLLPLRVEAAPDDSDQTLRSRIFGIALTTTAVVIFTAFLWFTASVLS